MIIPSSSSDRTPFSPTVSAHGKPASSARVVKNDQLSTASSAHLQALKNEPAVRPEMLALARDLAADSAHPPQDLLKRLARQILSTPDLTADES